MSKVKDFFKKMAKKGLKCKVSDNEVIFAKYKKLCDDPTLKETRKVKTSAIKRGWKKISGKRIYFRSGWEYKYAQYLQWQKENKVIKKWEHEPETFWFEGIRRGCVSYLPDFKVTNNDGTHFWVEVKGYMDAKSATKLKRFAKYYPNERLVLVREDWFKKHKS